MEVGVKGLNGTINFPTLRVKACSRSLWYLVPLDIIKSSISFSFKRSVCIIHQTFLISDNNPTLTF